MLFQLLLNGLVRGTMYGIIAVGFSLVYNTTRIFHIAYAGLYIIPAYLLYTLHIDFGFSIVFSVAVSILATLLLSILIELIIYRPLIKKESSLNVLMVTSIGVMIVLVNLIALIYGNELRVLNPDITRSITIGLLRITNTQIIQVLVSCFGLLGFLSFLQRSNLGIRMRALRDDRELFAILGEKVQKLRFYVFGLSGIFLAIGSILVSYDVGIDPYAGLPMLMNAVVALIIGGIGNFQAPILGGMIIGILQALSVWVFSSRWEDAVTFTLLILFLLFKPNGLLGQRERRA